VLSLNRTQFGTIKVNNPTLNESVKVVQFLIDASQNESERSENTSVCVCSVKERRKYKNPKMKCVQKLGIGAV